MKSPEGAIVGLFQGTSHIFQGVAGAKASVIFHTQEAAAQTSGHGLREAVTPAMGIGMDIVMCLIRNDYDMCMYIYIYTQYNMLYYIKHS